MVIKSIDLIIYQQDELFRKVKSSCDNYQVVDTGPEAAQL